jgi:hypothetical protein
MARACITLQKKRAGGEIHVGTARKLQTLHFSFIAREAAFDATLWSDPKYIRFHTWSVRSSGLFFDI